MGLKLSVSSLLIHARWVSSIHASFNFSACAVPTCLIQCTFFSNRIRTLDSNCHAGGGRSDEGIAPSCMFCSNLINSIQFFAFFSTYVLAYHYPRSAATGPHASSDRFEVTACVASTCLWASFLWGVFYPWWIWYYQYVIASSTMYHYICSILFLSIDLCSATRTCQRSKLHTDKNTLFFTACVVA